MNLGSQILDSFSDFFQDNRAFVRAYNVHFYLHMFIFAALLGLMFYLHHRNKHDQLFVEDDKTLKSSVFFVSYPFSAALLIALFLSTVIYPTQHIEFRELVLLLMLIPIVRIVPGMIPSDLRKPLYFLVGLCVLDFLENIVEMHVLLQRLGLLLFTIITILLLACWLRPGSQIYQTKSRFAYKIAVWMGPLTLIILLISLVTNVVGSFSTSHKLVRGTVESVLVTIIIYAIMRVFEGLVILLIRRRSAKALYLVQSYAKQMERRTIVFIHLAALFFWFRGILWIFGLYQPTLDWLSIRLTETWTFGTVEISIGAVVGFFIILVITFILARVVRLILEMEIFPRLRLPRGIPGAISMVVGYTIIGFGFVLAISTAGVDLERFGLLAGAMGIGLGFGLRNIIENFFSGLILVFARPIQIGDIIEIDDLMGEVKQIGIRASNIMTFDGSEVIVPNSDIISNRVANWTLSDRRRRIKLPVKVAYGNEPDRVLELLVKIAREHQGVLESPEPLATFNGFGDNYLDFTLYYWISDNILKNKSEVALGVHKIIKEAGIDTPRPKGDFNLKIIDAPDKQQDKDKGNIDKNR
jgi:small-conductance mechanosensitive channel